MPDPMLLAALSALLPVWDAWCPDDGRVAAGLAALTTPGADLAQAGYDVFQAVEMAQTAGTPAWFTAGGLVPALEVHLVVALRQPVPAPVQRAHLVAVAVWFAIWDQLWTDPGALAAPAPAARHQARRVIAAVVIRAAQDGWRA